MNITIIGGGNLGSAIAKGLSAKFPNFEIILTGRNKAKLEALQISGIKISVNNAEACSTADIIILCVQPRQIEGILSDISTVLDKDKILVSTAAGFTLKDLEKLVPSSVALIRTMPNTATALGQSMTCISTNNAKEGQLEKVKSLFEAVGDTIIINDDLMQAATVLGASGIAFFLRYIRAVTQGGIQMGFHPEEAQQIAVQTAIGAASLVKVKTNHPESEIDKVTTPRGCTIEGLNEMEHAGMSSAVIKGLMASYNKINNIK